VKVKPHFLALVAVALASGCGADAESSVPTAVVTVTETASASNAAVPEAADGDGLDMTKYSAADVAALVLQQVASAERFTEVTQRNDPNGLLGRRNGYISAAVIADNAATPLDRELGVDNGATVEQFRTKRAAYRRYDYIQGILRSSPMLGSEYDKVEGSTLLRISGDLTPGAASAYKKAFRRAIDQLTGQS
jgi:hypothetical protein